MSFSIFEFQFTMVKPALSRFQDLKLRNVNILRQSRTPFHEVLRSYTSTRAQLSAVDTMIRPTSLL